jgi:hypothetical protein
VEARVLGTGVELDVEPEGAAWHPRLVRERRRAEALGEVRVQVVGFATVEYEGRVEREGGFPQTVGSVPVDKEPTRRLLEIAYAYRDEHSGDLLGDLRRGDLDVIPWEFYAAPFAIELGDTLRERLSGSWQRRDPRR